MINRDRGMNLLPETANNASKSAYHLPLTDHV